MFVCSVTDAYEPGITFPFPQMSSRDQEKAVSRDRSWPVKNGQERSHKFSGVKRYRCMWFSRYFRNFQKFATKKRSGMVWPSKPEKSGQGWSDRRWPEKSGQGWSDRRWPEKALSITTVKNHFRIFRILRSVVTGRDRKKAVRGGQWWPVKSGQGWSRQFSVIYKFRLGVRGLPKELK